MSKKRPSLSVQVIVCVRRIVNLFRRWLVIFSKQNRRKPFFAGLPSHQRAISLPRQVLRSRPFRRRLQANSASVPSQRARACAGRDPADGRTTSKAAQGVGVSWHVPLLRELGLAVVRGSGRCRLFEGECW